MVPWSGCPDPRPRLPRLVNRTRRMGSRLLSTTACRNLSECMTMILSAALKPDYQHTRWMTQTVSGGAPV
eukprot:8135820-Pyramimonas_sp.AAC.1